MVRTSFCAVGLTLALGAMSGALHADPALECSGSSQVEIGNCLTAMEAGVDGAIATSLEFAMRSAAELDEITEREVVVPALDAAQTAWVAYRDAHCEMIGATFGGGSGTGIAISSCRIELGRARVDALMMLAN